MQELKTVGVAQTKHRNLLHEAGYQVNAVVTRACWDALIADKNVRREETRVWDLLMAVRLRLGGGMGNMPIHGTSSFEVACGSNVGTVTVHVCRDCVLIALREENLTLPAKDQHGSLE